MTELTQEQKERAVVLLEIIVRPGDHDFSAAIREAQGMFGYFAQNLPSKPRQPNGNRMRPTDRKCVRARCSMCGHLYGLISDGTIRRHFDFAVGKYATCSGSHKLPKGVV